jgi:hypothetical protein
VMFQQSAYSRIVEISGNDSHKPSVAAYLSSISMNENSWALMFTTL